MIAYIEGTIKEIEDGDLTILVNGLGYLVRVPIKMVENISIGQQVELFTYQNVREDALELFGFKEKEDLEFFKQLIQVSGVGTRVGLAVLSQFASNEVKRAIIHGDIVFLTSVSGVGKKTAERIIIDLKESIGVVGPAEAVAESPAQSALSAVDALLSLGYTQGEAIEALQGTDAEAGVEEQIRAALKKLSIT